MANPKFKVSQPQIDRMIELRKDGIPVKKIAESLGVSEHTVSKYLNLNRVILSIEQRVKNVDEGKKILLGVDYLDSMRSRITREVELARAESLRKRYEDPVKRQVLSISNINKWNERDDNFKDKHVKKLHENLQKNMLEKYKVDSYTELMALFITRLNIKGEFIGPYIDSETDTYWKCAAGHVFERKPAEVRDGRWCKACNNSGCSIAQWEIYAYVVNLLPGIEVFNCKKKILSGRRELDIYVPSLNFAIEYNGLYWHSDENVNYKRNAARDKALDCHLLGINLFTIYEDEWLDPIKRELVKAMIRIRIKAFDGTKVFARKLELKKLTKNNEFKDFFIHNHIDGHSKAKYAYGLFLGQKLLVCASVRKNFNKEYEIARLATDRNYIVPGGAGKLIKAIKKDLKDKRLIAYSNNRFSMGNVYEKLGGVNITTKFQPSYYYTDGETRVWRAKCFKINDNVTLGRFPEVAHSELAQAHAGLHSIKIFGDSRPLYRIDDCGHKKWLLNPGSNDVTEK